MKSTVIRKGLTASIILGLGALLSACGGGGGSGGSAVSSGSIPANPTSSPSSSGNISPISPISSGSNGGSSASNIPTNPTSNPSSSSSGAFSTLFSKNIYEDQGTFNVPIIKVYIDGQPVNLILDTGDSGLVVNQSAVNIPSSDYISNYISHSVYSFNYFGSTYLPSGSISGVLASATVCLNPSITSSCVIMPIGVLTSGSLFPGEPNEGVFGLAGFGQGLMATAPSTSTTSASIAAFSYQYYLEQQTGINSYQLNFISLSNNYYANVSQTQPIGQLSFGNYNGNSNTLIPYQGSSGFGVTFGSSSNIYEEYSEIFDTASPFNFLNEDDLQAALADTIPHYFPSQQEGICAQYGWPNPYVDNAVVNSSYTISYTIYPMSYTAQPYVGNFVTEPPTSFCSNPPAFNLLAGVTIDWYSADGLIVNNEIKFSYDSVNGIFGLPAMFGHTFTYVLGAPSSGSQGIVQYLGIQ